jgi:hypothetical protein
MSPTPARAYFATENSAKARHTLIQWSHRPAFAVDPDVSVPVAATYSYRTQADFSALPDALELFATVQQSLIILIAVEDQLFMPTATPC